MDEDKPSIMVTGISGDLGLRLLPQLKEYRVTGIDLNPPETSHPLSFVRMDLGLEDSCRELFVLMRALRPVAVIHLAFAADPVRSGIGDTDRLWQINVGGAARVFEALTEANRDEEIIKKFIFLSCVFVYGTHLQAPATEDQKLAAHSLPVAIHKMESDQAIQQRAPSARGCSVYLLRSATFSGVGAFNYLVEAFRGTPRGTYGLMARKNGKRVPYIIPWGKKYMQNQVQFVHTEDVARVIGFILRKSEPESRRLTILNVSGRGEPLTVESCAEIAKTKLLRVPGEWTMRQLLRLLSKLGISGIPTEAIDFLSANPVMDTSRLREFLGPYYEDVIRYTASDAFADSFASPARLEADHTAKASS